MKIILPFFFLEAGPCPHEFPWAFDNGRKCCRSYIVANRSEPLQFDDSESNCMEHNWIDCANTNECISFSNPCQFKSLFVAQKRIDHVFLGAFLDQCPGFATVGLDGGCCSGAVSRWAMNEDPPCRGSRVTKDTPFSCCPLEEFTFVPDCANKRQRCLSSGENHFIVEN